MGVANGSNHIGVLTMVFPPDQKLIEYIRPRAREPFEVVTADPDAQYAAAFEYDLSQFQPLVSGPDNPEKVKPLTEVEGIKVQAAYIGSCNAGRFEDLVLAAEVLKGKKVHSNVRLVVTPISSKVMQESAEKGLLTTFVMAGATITTPGCGACFYANQSPLLLDDGEVCITASVENWPGRMGSAKAEIYLGNAAVVGASAIEGQIANPAKYY
jgi:3-isopropylmalate/(R)-2-methylmalate dehydratase large subunit